MAWFKILGKRAHTSGFHDQLLGLITAQNAVHARIKAKGLFNRKILEVEEMEVRMRPKRSANE